MTVFLDTVGLLALWDTSDQWHAAAAEAYAKLAAQRATVVTTAYVLLESGNAAARRPYRKEVDRLRRILEATGNLIPYAASSDTSLNIWNRSVISDASLSA